MKIDYCTGEDVGVGKLETDFEFCSLWSVYVKS